MTFNFIVPSNKAVWSKTVREPWFSAIADGTKIYEGRLLDPESGWDRMETGDFLLILSENKQKVLVCKIAEVFSAPNFKELIYTGDILDQLLPGIKSRKEAVRIYDNIYFAENNPDRQRNQEIMKNYGVGAFRLEVLLIDQATAEVNRQFWITLLLVILVMWCAYISGSTGVRFHL